MDYRTQTFSGGRGAPVFRQVTGRFQVHEMQVQELSVSVPRVGQASLIPMPSKGMNGASIQPGSVGKNSAIGLEE